MLLAQFGSISWVAVVAAVVVQMALGFLWYGRALFANRWMKEVGIDPNKIASPGPAYAFVFIGALVEAVVLALAVKGLKVAGPVDGALTGFVVAIGFVCTTIGANYIFAGRSRALYLIDAGYHVVGLVLMGVVMGLF